MRIDHDKYTAAQSFLRAVDSGTLVGDVDINAAVSALRATLEPVQWVVHSRISEVQDDGTEIDTGRTHVQYCQTLYHAQAIATGGHLEQLRNDGQQDPWEPADDTEQRNAVRDSLETVERLQQENQVYRGLVEELTGRLNTYEEAEAEPSDSRDPRRHMVLRPQDCPRRLWCLVSREGVQFHGIRLHPADTSPWELHRPSGVGLPTRCPDSAVQYIRTLTHEELWEK